MHLHVTLYVLYHDNLNRATVSNICCSVSAAMTHYNVQHNVLYNVGSVFLALAIKINLSYADEF